jgi:hypothetical protein
MSHNQDAMLARASNLVQRLRLFLLVLSDERRSEQLGNGAQKPLPSPFSPKPTPTQSISEIVDSLDRILADSEYGTKSSKHQLPVGEFWSLGSIILRLPIRTIHGGFVEPLMRAPIIRHVPETVVAFLLEIPGGRDLLQREHHNQIGWHYHYLNFKEARSDVVLCWDTRAVRQDRKDHPLFQETHGKGFAARPDLWGSTKKKSMHDALRTGPRHVATQRVSLRARQGGSRLAHFRHLDADRRAHAGWPKTNREECG